MLDSDWPIAEFIGQLYDDTAPLYNRPLPNQTQFKWLCTAWILPPLKGYSTHFKHFISESVQMEPNKP